MRHLFAFLTTASQDTSTAPTTAPYHRQICQDPVKLIPRVLRSSLPLRPEEVEEADAPAMVCDAAPKETQPQD